VIRSSVESAKVYDLAHVARSFREVAVDVIRGESTEFLSRWYQAKHGEADLTIWWDGDRRLVKQQLCLYGQVVEWNPIHGTRTGLVVEHEACAPVEPASGVVTDGTGDETAEIVHYDSKPQRTAVFQAIALIREVGAIPEADRALVVYNFRESPKLHKNARERALKAWAQQGEELLSSARPGFWKRLGRWMFGK
jgi:hypothetical protein